MTRQYRAAAGRARNAEGKAAGLRTRGARTVTDLVPGLPRVELSGQLAKRQLPKTGNLDVLIERLVEADSK
jgi:hypothetical protein